MQLIVPAYNEESRLPATLARLRSHTLGAVESVAPLEVIVVDNGSTDRTAEVARAASSPAMPVRVIDCDRRGKGAAVRAGMAATTADLVGFMDADGATHLEALVEGARVISAGADVAIASRAVPGSVTTQRHSWVRGKGAAVYRRCTQRIAPGINDTQCGFKMFRGALAREVFAALESDGFSFDVELLGRLQRRGARITEFPATWQDVPGSTFLPFWHGAATFLELARIAKLLEAEPMATLTRIAPAEPAAAVPVAVVALLPVVEG